MWRVSKASLENLAQEMNVELEFIHSNRWVREQSDLKWKRPTQMYQRLYKRKKRKEG